MLPDLVIHNQTQRFMVLATLYAKTQAKAVSVGDLGLIALEKGLAKHEFERIVQYLVQESLISNPVDGVYAQLTHKGIRAIELVFQDINRPSDYFPAYTRMIKNL